MITLRAGSVCLGAMLAVSLLTACGGSSVTTDIPPGDSGGNGVAIDVRPGIPDGLEVDPTDNAVAATWIIPGETFAIVTWGSSSCAPVASALTAKGDSEIALTFAPSPNDPCTADMVATTHEFAVPDEVTQAPLTIDVSHSSWDESHMLTLE